MRYSQPQAGPFTLIDSRVGLFLPSQCDIRGGSFTVGPAVGGLAAIGPATQVSGWVGKDFPGVPVTGDYSIVLMASANASAGGLATHIYTSNSGSLGSNAFYIGDTSVVCEMDANPSNSISGDFTKPTLFIARRIGNQITLSAAGRIFSTPAGTGTRTGNINTITFGRNRAGNNNGNQTIGYAMGAMSYAPTDEQVRALGNNPWQLFSDNEFIFPAPAAGTTITGIIGNAAAAGPNSAGVNSGTNWDPTTIGANASLDITDLTIAGKIAAWGAAKGTTPKADNRYFEVVIAAATTNIVVGAARAAATNANFVGFDAAGIGYFNTGDIYANSVLLTTAATYTAADVIGVAVDPINSVVKFYKNNTLVYTSASAAISGSGAVYPMVSVFNTGAVGTGRFKSASMSYSPPSTYLVWDDTGISITGIIGNAAAAGITAVVNQARTVVGAIGNAVAAGVTAQIPLQIKGIIGNAVANGITASVSISGTTSNYWNPADKAATIALSNSNKTAQDPSNANTSVRGITSHTTGKYYFEIKTDAAYSTGVAIDTYAGIANATTSLSGQPIFGGIGGLYTSLRFGNGQYGANDASISTISSVLQTTNGAHVLGLAVDLGAASVDYYVDNVFKVSISYSTTGSAMFPFTTPRSNYLTLAPTTSEFTYTPPVGYIAWENGITLLTSAGNGVAAGITAVVTQGTSTTITTSTGNAAAAGITANVIVPTPQVITGIIGAAIANGVSAVIISGGNQTIGAGIGAAIADGPTALVYTIIPPVTWNPLDASPYVPLSNGNLTTRYTASQAGGVRATISKSSGKWYFEIKNDATNTAGHTFVGLTPPGSTLAIVPTSPGVMMELETGYVYVNGNPLYQYTFGWGLGDVVSVYFDVPNRTLTWRRNGGTAYTVSTVGALSSPVIPYIGYAPGGDSQDTINFGRSNFQYPVPSGYSPLDTDPNHFYGIVGNAYAQGISAAIIGNAVTAGIIGNAVANGVTAQIKAGAAQVTITGVIGRGVAVGITANIKVGNFITGSIGNAVAQGTLARIYQGGVCINQTVWGAYGHNIDGKFGCERHQ